MIKKFLAIDLGASSGRHIVGYERNGEIVLRVVHRFKTGMDESKNGLVWNIPRLFKEIKIGIKKAFSRYEGIVSLAVDTWGVDYVLMNGDKEIPPFYAYRNKRNVISSQKVHSIIPFKEIYQSTGIQYASFNTLYQLFDDLEKGRLANATDYLMLPSYFTYKLTGIKTHEYTNESTGALLNAKNKEYDYNLLNKLGLPLKLFTKFNEPGTYVGELLPNIQKEVKGNCKVFLVATHDTASAFESISTLPHSVILSSGTWSLLGIKSTEPIINEKSLKANYTNEGGISYIRFLKNIMGMWILNKLREETLFTLEYLEIVMRTVDIDNIPIYDVNDPSLLAPSSMLEAVSNLLKDTPVKNNLDIYASTFKSMAICYKKAIDELSEITNEKYEHIYIVGGGAKNLFLNDLIAKYTNLDVIAMPIEATALGNIKIQMKASKNL